MTQLVKVNGQTFLVHSQGMGFPLQNKMVCGPLQSVPTGNAFETDQEIYAHIDDKLHRWSGNMRSFVAVKLSKYGEVFRDLNDGNGEAMEALQAENTRLAAELTKANAEVTRIKSVLSGALG